MTWRGRALALCGGALAAAGWLGAGSVAGALAWGGAFLISCLGYGLLAVAAAARLQRWAAAQSRPLPPSPLPLVGALGYALLTLLGTALAQLGLFAAPVQRGAVVLGVAALAALASQLEPAPGSPPRRAGWGAWLGVVSVGVALAILQLYAVDLVIHDDEINHVMALARLWDAGDLVPLRLSLGGQVVGEALASLSAGAESPFFLDGLGALALLGLALSLGAARGKAMLPALAVMGAWMLLFYPPEDTFTLRWPAGALHLGLFALLRQLFDEAPALGSPAPGSSAPGSSEGGASAPRRGEQALVSLLALALASLRSELVPVALVYVASAFVLGPRGAARRWTRQQLALALAAAFLTLFALGLASGGAPLLAASKAAACLVAVALARAALLVLGTFPWWSALGAAALAYCTGVVSSRLGLLPIGVNSFNVGLSLFVHAPFLLALLVEEGGARRGARLYPLVAALLLGWVLADVHQAAFTRNNPLTTSTVELGMRGELAQASGLAADQEALSLRLRRLQARTPRGAALGLWGRSAGSLDYRRNPIRDVSWTAISAHRRSNRAAFLGGLTAQSLAGVDYVIVESFASPLRVVESERFYPKFDRPLPTFSTPTSLVADRLELVAEEGNEQLYKVRR